MNKLYIRLRVCYRILFRKYNHWALLNVKEEDFIKLLTGQEFTIDADIHGLHKYNLLKLIKQAAESYDEIDMLLEKTAFEAEAGLNKKTTTSM